MPLNGAAERAMANRAEHWDWSIIGAKCRAEALRILCEPHDAEDAAQEAVTRAWRSRHSCRNPEEPLPWCVQIARNEAFRLIAHRRGLGTSVALQDIEVLEDARGAQEPMDAELRVDIVRALRALTPHERLLTALRYEHDWSHADIAARFGIPEATARVRLHRAQKRLRTLL
jgi:RNA polymerase sigma-70 factor (ECF subfamily)